MSRQWKRKPGSCHTAVNKVFPTSGWKRYVHVVGTPPHPAAGPMGSAGSAVLRFPNTRSAQLEIHLVRNISTPIPNFQSWKYKIIFSRSYEYTPSTLRMGIGVLMFRTWLEDTFVFGHPCNPEPRGECWKTNHNWSSSSEARVLKKTNHKGSSSSDARGFKNKPQVKHLFRSESKSTHDMRRMQHTQKKLGFLRLGDTSCKNAYGCLVNRSKP